jgi:DNA-3-methyladenine glycosylase
VYVSYEIHHCVNVVSGEAGRANGVLLRAVSPAEGGERAAAGPALLASRFGIDRRHDALAVTSASGLWLAPLPPLRLELARRAEASEEPLLCATRIGISQGQGGSPAPYPEAMSCRHR